MLFYWLSISSPYRLSKDWTLGLLTTFHANTPDVKRFFQVMYLPLLTFRAECSLFASKSAHSTRLLPPTARSLSFAWCQNMQQTIGETTEVMNNCTAMRGFRPCICCQA